MNVKAICSYLQSLSYNALITPLVYPTISILVLFLEICDKFCVKNPSSTHRAGVKGEVKGQMRADHLDWFSSEQSGNNLLSTELIPWSTCTNPLIFLLQFDRCTLWWAWDGVVIWTRECELYTITILPNNIQPSQKILRGTGAPPVKHYHC